MRSCVFLLFLLVFPFPLFAADATVYYVNQGIGFYEAGDFQAALAAFEEAAKSAPNDFRITYNQACTLYAAGRLDEAVEKFRKTAFAPDRLLVYDSLLNLGNIAVDQARDYLADPPEKTLSGNRKALLSELADAEKEFSDALLIAPDRTEAKENLEIVRSWKSSLEQSWAKQDRLEQSKRISADDLLERIERNQRNLRDRIRADLKSSDSPKKYQSLFLGAKDQSALVDEIGDFKEKWEKTVSAAPEDEKLPPDPMNRWIEDFAQHSANAAKSLSNYDGESAIQFQAAALEMLDTIHNRLRDYERFVRDSVRRQTDLTTESEKPEGEPGELLWKQRFVYRWVQLLLEDARKTTAQPLETTPLSPTDDTDEEEGADMFRERESTPEELLRQSMQTAVSAGPELERLFKTIFSDLEQNRLEEAKPSIRQLRDQLRKILEPLDEKSSMLGNFERNGRPSREDADDWNAWDEEGTDNENDDRQSTPNDSDSRSGKGKGEHPSPGEGESEPENETGDSTAAKEGGSQRDQPKGEQNSASGASGVGKDGKVSSSDESEKTSKEGDESPANKNSAGSTPQGGSAKSDQPVSGKSPKSKVAQYDPSVRDKLTPEEEEFLRQQQREERNQAETLIRTVKRRQQDAQKFRNQIRQLFEPTKEKEPKDW